jgi:hypothetical protein
VENLLDGMFAQAKQLKPAGVDLLTGIVIEPTLLERTRFPLNRPLSVDGGGTRAEKSASIILSISGSLPGTRNVEANLEQTGSGRPLQADINNLLGLVDEETITTLISEASSLSTDVQSVTQSLSGDNPQYSTTIAQPDLLVPSGDDLLNEALIVLEDFRDVLTEITPLSITVQAREDSGSILAEVASFTTTVTIADFIKTDLTGVIQGDFITPVVESANDLTTAAGTEFFTHPSGSYGVQKLIRVRVKDNILTDKGDWVEGATYAENDRVTQRNQTGSAAAGNDREYRCLTTNVLAPNGTLVSFQSFVAPSLDRRNWAPVAFFQRSILEVRKAIISGSSPIGSGSVTVVPFDTAGTPFIGYAPTHYKFFRDTSTGYNRCRFIGCQQTIDTTPDAKSPIEIFDSSGAQIFVVEGNPPIQRSDDEGGPILEVR